jgi:hypothetical protein
VVVEVGAAALSGLTRWAVAARHHRVANDRSSHDLQSLAARQPTSCPTFATIRAAILAPCAPARVATAQPNAAAINKHNQGPECAPPKPAGGCLRIPYPAEISKWGIARM